MKSIALLGQHSENNPIPATDAARGNPYIFKIVFNSMIGQALENKRGFVGDNPATVRERL